VSASAGLSPRPLAGNTAESVLRHERRNRLTGARPTPRGLLPVQPWWAVQGAGVRLARPHPAHGQDWPTFLKNHAQLVWSCDFLPVIDLFFWQFYAFFIIELGSRRVVHCGVTSHPTDAWVAQQLREVSTAVEN